MNLINHSCLGRGVFLSAAVLSAVASASDHGERAVVRSYVMAPPSPEHQSVEDAAVKSAGCLTCHEGSDHKTMHENPGVVIGCTDCHGGDASVKGPGVLEPFSSAYAAARDQAHILPRFPESWRTPSSANPPGTYILLNRESAEFVRFINPGDLRVARLSCGACHLSIIQASERSLMSTSAMLFGGAAYNNGILPFKRPILGEAYTDKSEPASLKNPILPSDFMTMKGILPQLFPLPAWETIPPGDVFRVFERGGRVISSQFPEIGLPNNTGVLQKLEEPGRPDLKQSNRGPGTGNRVSIPVLNMTKTRLNDQIGRASCRERV